MAVLPDPDRSRAVLIGASTYRYLEDLPADTALCSMPPSDVLAGEPPRQPCALPMMHGETFQLSLRW
jgi:hypothetical protein